MKSKKVFIMLGVIAMLGIGAYFFVGRNPLWQESPGSPDYRNQEKQEFSQEKRAIPQLNEYTTASGLKVEVLKEGSGDGARAGNTVSVHYVGTLTNGMKFDSSIDRGEPISFKLGEGRVIKGWEEGILGMKVGEKRRLTIPSDLGYGARGAGDAIPPNATLIFETEMMAIQ